jgi:hypothetical protein
MKQGMFGAPVAWFSCMSVFHLLWMYSIKAVDNHKKAQHVCDGQKMHDLTVPSWVTKPVLMMTTLYMEQLLTAVEHEQLS